MFFVLSTSQSSVINLEGVDSVLEKVIFLIIFLSSFWLFLFSSIDWFNKSFFNWSNELFPNYGMFLL